MECVPMPRKRIECLICGKKFWYAVESLSDQPDECPLCGADYKAIIAKRKEERELMEEMFGIKALWGIEKWM